MIAAIVEDLIGVSGEAEEEEVLAVIKEILGVDLKEGRKTNLLVLHKKSDSFISNSFPFTLLKKQKNYKKIK